MSFPFPPPAPNASRLMTNETIAAYGRTIRHHAHPVSSLFPRARFDLSWLTISFDIHLPDYLSRPLIAPTIDRSFITDN